MRTIVVALLLIGCGGREGVDAGPRFDAGMSDAGPCMQLGDTWQIAPSADVLSSTCNLSTYSLFVAPDGVTWGEEAAVSFPGCRPTVTYVEQDGSTECTVEIAIHCVDDARELVFDASVRGPVMRPGPITWTQDNGGTSYNDGSGWCLAAYNYLSVCRGGC